MLPEELIGKHYSVLVHDDDIERARYVFNERRVGDRASRNVELRLKSLRGNDQERTFENTLMTISFNSMGMYALGKEVNKREFFGTYGVCARHYGSQARRRVDFPSSLSRHPYRSSEPYSFQG